MSGKGTKRKTWSEEEVRKLITVWQSSVNDLRMMKRNSLVYKRMSDELASVGVNATHIEIRMKVNNLTQRYREEKKKVGPSGGSPSQWSLYTSVHEVIGRFASNDVTNMHESIEIEFLDSELGNPDSSNSSRNESSEGSLLSGELLANPASPASSSAGASTSRARKRKLSLKHQIIEEIKKTNILIEEDSKECKRILQDSENRDKLWFQMTKNYLDRSLELQEKFVNANVKD